VDGHAKDFSIFLRRDGYELTPFYDLLSAWPVWETKPANCSRRKSNGDGDAHWKSKPSFGAITTAKCD
jgi:serine/threonine protein kinase HipA of HipAB toxin-antitoxin module